MRLLLVTLIVGILYLCADIHAQITSSGTTTVQSCTSKDGKRKGFMAYDASESNVSGMVAFSCLLNNGAPPKYKTPVDQLFGGYPHWECEDGYELSGLTVTWEGGVFTPRPDRCEAKP